MNMNNFSHFFQYHNAIPVALGILVLGGGAAFAATNPEVIYSQEQKIVSVDNTYIANKDLSVYSPQVTITGVTEDADTYYVTYTMRTIDVDDAVWKDIDKTATMSVDKKLLGTYGDLGLYVTEQLNQNISHETDRLKEVQEIERRHVSQKTIATAYGGLIGNILHAKTETLPGYTRVAGAPVLALNGETPATILTGETYADMGATATDNHDTVLYIYASVDDGPTIQPGDMVTLDTTEAGEHTIAFTVTDEAGNTSTATRTVSVEMPPSPSETTEGQSAAAPVADPTPPPPRTTPSPRPRPRPRPRAGSRTAP